MGSLVDRGKRRQRSAIGLLRAIGWIARKAQCEPLIKMLASKTISTFWDNPQGEREETMALPGKALADFEWRCNPDRSSTAEVLFYGAFLLMVWAGIRFADTQRCKPQSTSIERGTLRGSCWQTKTSDNGQPWAANPFGLLGRPPAWGWGHHWLTAMNTWLQTLPATTRSKIDFLLPDMGFVSKTEHGAHNYHIMPKPMKYMRALVMFRKSLCRANETIGICVASTALAAAAYSLHLKVTLLSMAKQLGEEPRHCAEHGHHRVPSGLVSVRLYSRYDVWGALLLQMHIITAFARGWWPSTPQGRGGMIPIRELPLVGENKIPPVTSSWCAPLLPIFVPLHHGLQRRWSRVIGGMADGKFTYSGL